jgi:hypothetical protein
MQFIFTPVPSPPKMHQYIYLLDLHLNINHILELLKDEEWEFWSNSHNNRSVIANCKNPELNSILTEIRESRAFKKELLDLLFSTTSYHFLWHYGKDVLLNNTTTTAVFYKDSPSFELGPHLDPRNIVASAMYFLTKSEKQGSVLYSSKNSDDPFYIMSDRNPGWVLANTAHSWHGGGNYDSIDRISLYLDVCIDLK